MRNSVTIVPFFDSLGKEALAFVINQTNLTTMCVELKNFESLLSLKTQGLIEPLTNIVVFEGVTQEQKDRA